jgi:serine/threonine protein kinase
MGEVYRAHDTRLSRDVPIKVLPEAFAQDAGWLSRFDREAKAVASLSHPNILAIIGAALSVLNWTAAESARSAACLIPCIRVTGPRAVTGSRAHRGIESPWYLDSQGLRRRCGTIVLTIEDRQADIWMSDITRR